MNPVKFIKNHQSFIVTLTLVLASLFLVFKIIQQPLYRSWIVVNIPYLFTIACVSLAPILVVKRFHWYPEAAPLYAWALLFLSVGFYIFLNQGPNIIGFILDFVTLKIRLETFLSTVFGSLTLMGIFTFYYFLMAFISGQKDNSFSSNVDLKTYYIWAFACTIYLNMLVSIVNAIFRR